AGRLHLLCQRQVGRLRRTADRHPRAPRRGAGGHRHEGADRGAAQAGPAQRRGQRRGAAPADSRRRVPGAHRARGRGARPGELEEQEEGEGMTTLATAPQGGFGGALARTLSDGGTITWRNLMNIRRNPELLLSATVQPIMFVLLFAYVFGGSIGDDPVAYRDFLMGGIFVQTVAFNSAF